MNHNKFLLLRLLILRTVLTVFLLAIGFGVAYAVANIPAFNNLLLPFIISSVAVVIVLFLLFGRIYCGFFCPLGLLNDFVWQMTSRLHLPKLSRNEKFMKKVRIVRRINVVLFILTIISLIGIAIFFPELLSNIHITTFEIVTVVVFFVIVASFARRLFCNVCPFGIFIGFFEKLNIVKLKKDCSACTMCGACYEACPMRIKSVYTEQEKSDVSNKQCIYCGECIKKCQEDDALYITVCGKKIYKSSKEDFMNNQFSDVTLKRKDKE